MYPLGFRPYQSLPVKVSDHLSFDQSIVIELKYGRNKIFFTVLYRSPSFNYTTPAFAQFLDDFKNLYAKIHSENPHMSFFSGDFNYHSQFWCPGGNTSREGKDIEEPFSSLNLTIVTKEPTDFTPGKNPSCIDLIVAGQPNLILNNGSRDFLDSKCHHQIIHCKVNFKVPPLPPIERKLSYYNKANIEASKKV